MRKLSPLDSLLGKMPEVKFVEEGHRYLVRKGDGWIPVPSASQVCSCLDNFAGIDPEVLTRAADRGTAVHLATEMYDLNGSIDMDALPQEIRGYVEGWIMFRKQYNVIPLLSERVVVSKRYDYAGRLDRLVQMTIARKKINVLIDLKTGGYYPSYGPRLAGYIRALGEWVDTSGWLSMLVFIGADGRFKVRQFSDSEMILCWNTFLAGLTIYRWKEKHNVDQ